MIVWWKGGQNGNLNQYRNTYFIIKSKKIALVLKKKGKALFNFDLRLVNKV